MEKVQVEEGVIAGGSLSKSAPVAVGGAVSGLNFFGVSVSDLVPLLTCLYLLVMTGHTVWKWYVDVHKGREEHKDSP